MGLGSGILLLIIASGVLVYHRASIVVWSLAMFILMGIITYYTLAHIAGVIIIWIILAAIAILFAIKPLRRRLFSKSVLRLYRKLMPTMSQTERDALEAGDVSFDAEIFSGAPNWQHLFDIPPARLSAEEQAFLDGPVEQLCQMLNDWEITHHQLDLPESVWQYMKTQRFFGMIIPKKYGGLAFSAYANARVLIKIGSTSITAMTTVSVPNSLGPAELLCHYGTEAQRDYYLPKLASGEAMPCFALTGPDAGSDAASMPDFGVVCQGTFEGKQVLGIRLNFNKRYITLAPIATVIGLAFKLYDPEHLIGETESIGITCALIPRDTAGIEIGRRHLPCNIPFQNGPIRGQDVFIPMDYVIGGQARVGQGWRMLMECLAAGRAVSLPSSAIGGSKLATYTTGAYARLRRQFNVAISEFEGIQEPLARIAGLGYMIDSAQRMTLAIVDSGKNPSVLSAIIKYHTTENGRKLELDAMDVHGGKAICLGPNNYLGRSYQAAPIMITVEGANILTRNLIIYGQGATRCHPYVFAEMQAARIEEPVQALSKFDNAFFGHIGFLFSNIVRSFCLSISSGYIAFAPKSKVKHYYQMITRLSSAFALLSDVAMLIIGADLKRKESLSAKLGDIFSKLYLTTSVLKRFHDDGEPSEDLPVVHWACQQMLHEAQRQILALLRNFPNQFAAFALRLLIFPFGARYIAPSDSLSQKVAKLITSNNATRTRLVEGIFKDESGQHMLATIQKAFEMTLACKDLEKRFYQAVKQHELLGVDFHERVKQVQALDLITETEAQTLITLETLRKQVIDVDDFSLDELLQTKMNDRQANHTDKPKDQVA